MLLGPTKEGLNQILDLRSVPLASVEDGDNIYKLFRNLIKKHKRVNRGHYSKSGKTFGPRNRMHLGEFFKVGNSIENRCPLLFPTNLV